ncbi:MAG: carboxypeptidase-like regulatory domain-containing protein [Chitinophagaceae bacterium]|nr:carboxypeptidase-like regulatory domain-containing protein [Chitinophagaceae bacterium]
MRSFKTMLLLIVVNISAANAFSQNTFLLKGTIVDEETNSPLVYASIGMLNRPVGTISDTVGNYFFEISNEYVNDTLQVSHAGYETKKLLLSEFAKQDDKTIKLVKRVISLQEIVLSNRSGEEESFGRNASGKLMQVSLHNKTSADMTVGSEMGIRIKPKSPALLKNINWYISANNFRSIKFRVNVYSVKNNMPDSLSTDKQIFGTVGEYITGWIQLDLEPYNIKVDKDFIITIQWIESKTDNKDKPVTMIPAAVSFSKDTYVRIASQDKWKRMGLKLSYFVTVVY